MPRMASLPVLQRTTVALFLTPVPCKETLRTLFDRERIPKFKSNPSARRGGGTVYYSTAAVEKLFRSRLREVAA